MPPATGEPGGAAAEIDEYADAVLSVVESIAPGCVTSYGRVAAAVGAELGAGGPRQVARVLRRYGAAAPWWRVLRADGTPAPEVADRQLARLAAEGLLARNGRVPRSAFVEPARPGKLSDPSGTVARTPPEGA